MDLTFQADQNKLNIRVAVILKSEEGYIFCEHKEGYYYPVGGRVKINESSLEAAYREVQEELGYEMRAVKLCSVLENFFVHGQTSIRVHEFCFIYECEDILEINLPQYFVSLNKDEVAKKDVRPRLTKELIAHPAEHLVHQISK